MLACRPMLCLAVAAMLGILLQRLHPAAVSLIFPGWLLFAGLVAWFVRTPQPPPAPPALPAGYGAHVFPVPGFVARRGLNRFMIILCLAVFLAGMMRQRQWALEYDEACLPGGTYYNATMLALEPANALGGASKRWRCSVLLLTRDGQKLEHRVALRLYSAGNASFRRGDMLQARVRARYREVRPYPGAFNSHFFLEREGLLGAIHALKPQNKTEGDPCRIIPVDSVSPYLHIRRAIDAIRAAAITNTRRYGGDQGPMLATMLFGDRSDLSQEVRDAFRRVGIGHVLAISGLHVGLVVGLLWWLVGWIGWPRRWRAVACLGLSIIYLGLAGGQVAAMRATAMAVIHLAGIAFGRKSDMLNSLGAAAFFIALANPTAPMDVSFQLSFTAVIFIFIAMGWRGNGRADIRNALSGPRAFWRSVVDSVISLLWLSVATWVGLYPIITYVFNQVNPAGLPVNIPVIPLMAVLLACGLVVPLLGWLPGMGWLLTLPARLLHHGVMWCDSLYGSSFAVHAPNGVWVGAFYVFVLVYLLRGMLSDGRRRVILDAVALGGALITLAGMTISMTSRPPPESGRIAVMPGYGFGTIVAESPSGDIAVLGNLQRGGLNEAGWLHYLKRGGKVSLVAVGGTTPVDMLSFAYHYPMQAFTSIPRTSQEDAGGETGWQTVPGTRAIEYAVRRNAKGGVNELGVRAGDETVWVMTQARLRDLGDERKVSEGKLYFLSFADRKETPSAEFLPGAWVAVRGKFAGSLPPGWFMRWRYGVLELGNGLRGYDGEKWVEITSCPPSAKAE